MRYCIIAERHDVSNKGAHEYIMEQGRSVRMAYIPINCYKLTVYYTFPDIFARISWRYLIKIHVTIKIWKKWNNTGISIKLEEKNPWIWIALMTSDLEKWSKSGIVQGCVALLSKSCLKTNRIIEGEQHTPVYLSRVGGSMVVMICKGVLYYFS